VVDAATLIVADEGYDALTIRSLAARLGVAPMSLYHHVRDKDDLLDEVVDRLLERFWRPDADESDWTGWLAEAAARLRAFLVGQPAAMHVYLRHPVASPAALTRMASMLAVLQRGGFDEHAALRAYAAVQTYTIGFAALEASRERSRSTSEADDPMRAQLAAFTSPQQFADGLRFLLDGIERNANRPSP